MPPLGIEKFDRQETFDSDYERLSLNIKKKVDRAFGDLTLPQKEFPSKRYLKKRNPKERKLWQIRIDQEYRMTFKVEGDLCVLYRIGTHAEIEKSDM